MDPAGTSIVLPAITAEDLQFIRMLGSASHESLLQSNNPYYARFYQESMILRALVDNESRLQARISELEDRLLQESVILKARVDNESRLQARISELEERLSAALPVSSHQNGSEARVLLPLSIPAPLAQLQQTDFPKVRFWTMKEWNDHKAAEQRRNETIHKLAFITNNCGEPVANEYLEQMSDTARMFFNELHTHGLAPPTWKAKSKAASDFFINNMALKFPELRWCEGGSWKAEAFAVTRYPDCSRKFFTPDDSSDHLPGERAHKKRRLAKSSKKMQDDAVQPAALISPSSCTLEHDTVVASSATVTSQT